MKDGQREVEERRKTKMSREKKKGGTWEGWTTQFKLIPALGEIDREKGV